MSWVSEEKEGPIRIYIQMRDTDDLRLRYLLLTFLAASGLLAVTLLYPMTMDHDVYETMAFELVRFGRLPYLGTWDMNFPGIVYIHALSILLFGTSEVGFRAMDAALHVAIALMLYRLLIRWITPQTAFLAAVFSCMFFLSGNDWNAGQRDGFATFFILLATTLLYQHKDFTDQGTPTRWLLAILEFMIGVLVGCSVAIRPTYGLFSVVILVALFSFSSKSGFRRTAWYIAGLTTLALAMLAPYLRAWGGLEQLYLATIRFNIDIYGSEKYRIPLRIGLLRNATLLVNAVALFAMFAFMLTRYRAKNSVGELSKLYSNRPSRFDLLLFAAYYLSAAASVVVMGKFFRHHFELLFLLSAVLFTIFTELLLQMLRIGRVQQVARLLLIAVVLFITYPWRLAGLYLTGALKSNDPVTDAQYAFASLRHREDQLQLASYITKQGRAGDRVEYVNEDPDLYWRTGLEPATRFTMIFPLAMQTPLGGYTPYQEQWRKEFVDSLEAVKPKFIVIANEPDSFLNFLVKSPRKLVDDIPGFDRLLQTGYQLDTTIAKWSIYRRRSVF
jgi:hypothetical protein